MIHLLLEIKKYSREFKSISKLGNNFTCKRNLTVFKIECDVCKRILHRQKGEVNKLGLNGKHSCSPECSQKLSVESKLQKIKRRRRNKQGYIYIGNRREHQIVLEQKINRPLLKGEIVHHVDGDKGNNSEENLVLCENRKQHNQIHGQLEALSMLLVQQGKIKFCHECKLYFTDVCNC